MWRVCVSKAEASFVVKLHLYSGHLIRLFMIIASKFSVTLSLDVIIASKYSITLSLKKRRNKAKFYGKSFLFLASFMHTCFKLIVCHQGYAREVYQREQ